MTSTTTDNQLEHCIALLQRGELREEDLRAAAGVLGARPTQSLLYAQCWDDSLFSAIHGMALFENGGRRELPADCNDWLYRSIADALQDGWRVIRFPDAVRDDERNCGLGCEFILEKIQ